MDMLDVDVGTCWYVQLAPRATLVEREVVEVTENTILLRDPHTRSRHDTARYRFDETTLVERC
jgi:hypothetical protein